MSARTLCERVSRFRMNRPFLSGAKSPKPPFGQAAAAPEPLVIGTTLNQRFSFDKELGRGGMGAVYRATDLILGRPVAIKVLKEQTGEEVNRRIRLEAQILARLVHENVVRIYDFGESDGIYYFVMEEVDGPSFTKRWRSLDLPGRLRVLAQVADALDYAHRQGVIHRDVKPGNVLLTRSDSARLSDFGLSILTENNQESAAIRGTPSYMSPEQAKGRRLDHRTDLYSLGVMFYECATGSTPFSGPTFSVIANHVSSEPDPPRSRNPALSAEIESLILRLLAKAPEARPASGAEVAESIRSLLTNDPTLGAAVTPGSKPNVADATRSAPRADGQPTAATLVAPGVGSSLSVGGSIGTAGQGSGTIGAAPAGVSAASTAGHGPSGIAERMLADVLAEPVMLSADERYLTGHYLAYLLGGSRRKGFLLRRPLDPLNADRARLLLAMTWLNLKGPTETTLKAAADLLDGRPDVRPSLSPVVVAKYLHGRDTAGKRRLFRTIRTRLQEASVYARDHLTNDRGVLNPGLMPQVLDDLRTIAPARTEVDGELVERWNRVADVWRDRPDFRRAVLTYATANAVRDAASAFLWPEVVYPLIERALWQRQLRSKPEMIWDQLLQVLHIPEPGNRLDRAVRTVVPARVVEVLDADVDDFLDEPELEPPPEEKRAVREAPSDQLDSASLLEIAADAAPARGLVRLLSPDPIRLTLGELRELWQEGVAALRTPGSKAGHRNVPVGPYRLAVIPSIRGRSAGEVAIQGMNNKQIEMLTPSLRLAGSGNKPIVAVWVYADDSLAIAYVDFRNTVRYISWYAPNAQQNIYEDPGDLNHDLYTLGLEAPEGLGVALTKRFRPRNPV
jgi:predicted Ser/Thr protein kinase